MRARVKAAAWDIRLGCEDVGDSGQRGLFGNAESEGILLTAVGILLLLRTCDLGGDSSCSVMSPSVE
jgi:hypothetical protein